ncbi:MAG: AI-2E family transporter [Actinomycetota bacterium]|nr:AI-2E family transporter [Actinomycetota bacterium]
MNGDRAPASSASRSPMGTAEAQAPPQTPPAGPTRPTVAALRRSRLDMRLMLTILLGVGGGMLLLDLTEAMLARLEGLLVAVAVSLFLSFGMEPAVQWLARKGMRRGLATALVFLAVGLLVVGFLAAMAPLVIGQVRTLVEQGPTLVAGLAERARELPGGIGQGLGDYLDRRAPPAASGNDILGQVGGGLLGFGSTLVGSVLQILTMLLVTFYLVADGPRFRRALSSRLHPSRQTDVLAIWELAIEKTGGYVYGRVLIAVASAAFHTATFTLIGLPYPLALGVWVGVVSSLIPVVGTYLGGALPVAIGLASSEPFVAVWVVAAVVVYQQLENYLIAPHITSHTMALHPAVAFLAVLVGAALLGAPGALLGLPTAAIIGALVSAAGERHEIVAHELLEETTD